MWKGLEVFLFISVMGVTSIVGPVSQAKHNHSWMLAYNKAFASSDMHVVGASASAAHKQAQAAA